MKLVKFTPRRDRWKAIRRGRISDTLNSWKHMDDLEDIIIMGKCSDGGLRCQGPAEDGHRIWWVGALENVKHDVNNMLEKTRQDYEEGGSEEDE